MTPCMIKTAYHRIGATADMLAACVMTSWLIFTLTHLAHASV